jgi:hypothetical protein
MSAPPTEEPDEAFDCVEEEDDDDDDDDEDDDHYHDGDSEGDDDEAEFVPGALDEDDDDDTVVPLLDGHLFMDKDDKLHFQGQGFHLTAAKPPSWNLLNRLEKPKETMCTVRMEGSCDVEIPASGNQTHRNFDVTWTASDKEPASPGKSNGEGGGGGGGVVRVPSSSSLPVAAGLKDDGNGDDDGDAKQNGGHSHDDDHDEGQKLPPFYYTVYGHQTQTLALDDSVSSGGAGEIMEFQGGYHPGNGKRLSLVCRVRMVASKPASAMAAAGAAAGAASKPAAAAAASAAAHRVDDDDEDEDYDDADDEVDYEELIALHEDAGLPVDTLRKRYHSGAATVEDQEDNGKKKAKPTPKSGYDDDDDDSDYGF